MDLKFVFESRQLLIEIVEKACQELRECRKAGSTDPVLIWNDGGEQDNQIQGDASRPDVGECFQAVADKRGNFPLWQLQYMFLWTLYLSPALRELICQHSPSPVRERYMDSYEERFLTHVCGRMARHPAGTAIKINAVPPLNFTVNELMRIHIAYTTQ